MEDAIKVYYMDMLKMRPLELIMWLRDTATLQEAHSFYKANWDSWAPGALKFREHADKLTDLSKAAETKEKTKVEAFDQEYAEALSSIHLNANYIVIRAKAAKDESLLHNTGYVLREKGKNKKASAHGGLRKTAPVVKVRNDGPNTVSISYGKDPAAGAYQVQACKGKPTGEESWGDVGIFKTCHPRKSGLETTTWYFRVRCLGDNEVSDWSVPVGIIVT
jgi:hypothetical protein